MKKAFTLAEVLITLGVIGVVAAITIPTLIENHQKRTVETRLKKFYSNMSQAIQMWKLSEGLDQSEEFSFPSDTIYDGAKTLEWYNENFGKYMPAMSTKALDGYLAISFKDGSGVTGYVKDEVTMHLMYCVEYKHCKKAIFDGRNSFLFTIARGIFYTSYGNNTHLTREQLLEGCKQEAEHMRHTCARLIQYDGWQIKNDYPWR